MPTYDYVCRSCEHAFEAFQSMTAKPMKKCPACGRMQLKRLIGTGAGIIFKGSGFYETDYRSSEYRQKAKQETQSGSDSSADSSSKGDSQNSSDSGGGSTNSTSSTGNGGASESGSKSNANAGSSASNKSSSE